MNTAGILNNLFQPANKQEKVLSFRPGQMIMAKVNKLFPDHTAEIQIGGRKVIAQLEAPLTAHTVSWFQVQPGEGKIRLKIVEALSKGSQSSEEAAVKILREIALDQNKLNISTARFFLNEQLPVTKDYLKLAAEWLQNGGSGKGLETVKFAVINGFPLSHSILDALNTWHQNIPLTLQMKSLLQNLNAESGFPAEKQLHMLLSGMVSTQKERAGEQALPLFFKEWLRNGDTRALAILQHSGAVPNEEEGKILAKWLSDAVHGQANKPAATPADAILRFLTKGDIKSAAAEAARATAGGVQQVSFQDLEAAADTAGKLLRREGLERSLDNRAARTVKMLMLVQAGIAGETADANTVSDMELTSAVSRKIAETRIADWLQAAARGERLPFQAPEAAMLADMASQMKLGEKLDPGGQEITRLLKETIGRLGLSHEEAFVSTLGSQGSRLEAHTDSLKPLLLQYLNESTGHSPAAREAAESLVNKLSAFQLLSQEAGPIQQLALQIPLPAWSRIPDVTLQFSGQKTPEGNINPDYCRVLFYLQLEHLGDTIIDMQIQNRVIKIGIINDDSFIQTAAQPFISSLKSALSKKDYQLSSVNFILSETPAAKQEYRFNAANYNGVDIRI